jgi:hypothetical protein
VFSFIGDSISPSYKHFLPCGFCNSRACIVPAICWLLSTSYCGTSTTCHVSQGSSGESLINLLLKLPLPFISVIIFSHVGDVHNCCQSCLLFWK